MRRPTREEVRSRMDFPYRVGRRKANQIIEQDPVTLKAVQRLEGHLARKRHVEAIRIGSEAVKHLGIDEDEPL